MQKQDTLTDSANLFMDIKPILIYQMGKVGSSSIYKSLNSYGLEEVYHIHRIFPENIEKFKKKTKGDLEQARVGIEIYHKYILKNVQLKIICPVREPISRNISAFFNNYKKFLKNDLHVQNDKNNRLTKEFLGKYPHHVPHQWFDREFKKTTGIDVYDFDFNTEKGFKILKIQNFDILLLQIEMNDKEKEKLIGDFVELPNFKLIRHNVSTDKKYALIYEQFLEKVELTSEYIDKMLSSKYAKHFYSEEEIIGFKNRWTSKLC